MVQPLQPVLQYIINQDAEQVYTQKGKSVNEVFKTPYQYWHEFTTGRREQAEYPEPNQQLGLVVAHSSPSMRLSGKPDNWELAGLPGLARTTRLLANLIRSTSYKTERMVLGGWG